MSGRIALVAGRNQRPEHLTENAHGTAIFKRHSKKETNPDDFG
jgi:hypothetical protein